MAQPDTPVEVRGLSHAFAAETSGGLEVLHGIDLELSRREILAIVGPSGCGKTTLLNIIGGMEPPSTGVVTVHGRKPMAGTPDIGIMFARDALLPWRSAIGNVLLGMEVRGVPASERADRAERCLDDVGLAHVADSYPAELSQGMRQRVALARTFALQPKLLLMDEPFAALDAQTKILVQDRFAALQERHGMAVLLITHDLAEAIALADRVVLMTRRPGRVRQTYQIDLPRPRSIMSLQTNARFHELYEAIWNDLKVEVRDD